MSDDSEDLLTETFDALSATVDMEVDADHIREEYLDFAAGDLSDSRDHDQFLQHLHSQNIIDTPTYVRANRQRKLKLKHPRFEHLPDREPLYELLGALDSGGMGEVRIGRDPYLDRKVAIKLLKMEKVASPLAVERFVREAQVTAKLDHPNIIPIYSLHSESDGRASFSMKLIQGRTLSDIVRQVRDRLKEGKRPPEDLTMRRRIELFLRMCDAMSYAHDMGVIHRDLKPANVMVGEYNEVYVMDWGLAKILDDPESTGVAEGVWDAQLSEKENLDDSMKTQHGSLVGTPLYMPPEQATGQHKMVGYRSDVYSLGAILFELVTLRRLIPGTKVQEILKSVAQGTHREVEPYPGDDAIPRELAAILERATAAHPDARYPDVQVFAEDLRRYLDDEAVLAHPDGPVRAVQRWIGHHRGVTLSFIMVLMALAGGAVIWSLNEQNEATREAQMRQRKLSRFQTYVTEQAHKTDRQFLRFELLTSRLAVAASQLLQEGTPQQGPLYTNADFDGGSAPPDYGESQVYSKSISVQHPVFKPAPGVSMDEVEPTLRKLLPLTGHFQSVFVDSRLDSDEPVETNVKLWRTIAEKGVPGRWAYVGLANGVHISYPGKGGYPDDYDPRKRPWYAMGKDVGRPVWGEPYLDIQGLGLVLPCVTSVYGPGGDFAGVAGFEVTLDFVQDRFMQPYGPVKESYVLNEEGRVLVTSRGASLNWEVEDISSLPNFPVPSVVELVRNGASGYVIDRKDGLEHVYMTFQMPTLGWYYVAVAPLIDVLNWQ